MKKLNTSLSPYNVYLKNVVKPKVSNYLLTAHHCTGICKIFKHLVQSAMLVSQTKKTKIKMI